jgi:hypothetical protein
LSLYQVTATGPAVIASGRRIRRAPPSGPVLGAPGTRRMSGVRWLARPKHRPLHGRRSDFRGLIGEVSFNKVALGAGRCRSLTFSGR